MKAPTSRQTGPMALLTLALLAGTLLFPGGCRCICGDDNLALARVIQLVPVAEISRTNGAWAAATPHSDLNLGDALRTGDAGSAMLDVFGQGIVKVGPRSLVRFGGVGDQAQPGDGLRLRLEAGEMEVQAADGEAPMLVLTGPGGERVQLGRGSRVGFRFDDAERLQLNVQAGSATVERDGESTELAAGQTLSLGDAERLNIAPPVPDAGPSKVGDAAPPDAGAGLLGGGITVRLKGAEVSLKAPGEEEYKRVRKARITIEPGTGIKLSGRRPIDLVGPEGAVVTLQPGARAMFRGVGGDRLRVGLQGGSAEARSSGSGVAAIAAPGGVAETAHMGGAPAFLATVRDARSTRVNVRSGVATATSGGRQQNVLTGGEIILGGDFTITSPREIPPVFNSSAVIYDPQRTGNFTIRFPAVPGCKAYAIHVDRGGRRLVEAVSDRPVLAMKGVDYGDYRWKSACVVDNVVDWSAKQEGRVSRHGDRSGHALLPTKAPRSSLNTDGRSYNVTYQNRLPAITLRWANAPEAPNYYLEVVEDSSHRKLHSGRSPRAARGFKSGFFREGTYYWFFRTEGGGKRVTSPITKARITFDNVAPAIHIAEPREGAAASGTVRVRGTATVGSKVVANGVPLTLGGDYRFDQQVPVGRGNLLIIRVTAPRRGTGYYIRHLGGGGGE